jgi:hypothetical protein
MPVGILYKRKSVKMNVKFSVFKNNAKGHVKRVEVKHHTFLNYAWVQEGLRDMWWGDFTTTLCHHAVTPHSVLASSSGMLFSSEVQ